MADIKYDIVEEMGVLSENIKGWTKELNLINWIEWIRVFNKEFDGIPYFTF